MMACGILLWVSFGATAMIGVYNLAGGPAFVRSLMTGLGIGPIGVVLLMMAILVVLGCLMDWIGICLLTMPIFVPVIVKLGFDPIWFGMVSIVAIEIGLLTPPFGMVPFAMQSSMGKSANIEEIFAGSIPFTLLLLLALIVIIAVPSISTWLPTVL